MGKAMRWFKAMLGMKRENENSNSNSIAGDKKEKNRWSFSKSGKDFSEQTSKKPVPEPGQQRNFLSKSGEEQNQHAIAVAAASAAAADAAVAAAQAAVAVVRLTNRKKGALFYRGKEILAALKIQCFFRGFLARKALRALKGLVKLQALVRGYLVRKRAAATYHSMQALIRAQTNIRSQRARRSHNKENKNSICDLQWLIANDTIETPKIVEIDMLFKPKSSSNRPIFYSTMASPANFSMTNCREYQDIEWPETPAKSVCGEGYSSNYRNYMASTKSFKAKLRSRSAPKQRTETRETERDVMWKKRVALNEIMGPRNSMSSVGLRKSCHCVGEEDQDQDQEEEGFYF